jgi:hypothetical protein
VSSAETLDGSRARPTIVHAFSRSPAKGGTIVQPTTSELRFRYGEASAAELQAVVEEVLSELQDQTSEAAEQARQAGLDPVVLATADVSVREEQQGLDPLMTTILVEIVVQVGAHVVTQFWDDVIWPRLRRRLGAKAVGDEVQ